MHNERLDYLFSRRVAGTIDAVEEEEFRQLAERPELQGRMEELIGGLMEKIPGMPMPEGNIQATLQAIFQAAPAQVVTMRRKTGWLRVAVAAAVLLMLGTGAWFLFSNKQASDPAVVQNGLPGDVKAPQRNRAMITLANGQQVFLDSAGNGKLAGQGSVSIVKLADGQIAYNTDVAIPVQPEPKGDIIYNTLSNPRGSRIINIALADGSRVWLNAGSSVTYPVTFTGNERNVSITGEAYFEVAHDATKPFYVTNGNMQVQVLGTHFNVNAYDDEPDIRVTLLEGSVRATIDNRQSVILKPGEQARVGEIRAPIRVIRDIDVAQVIAWKNGRFQFEGAGIEEVMRQLARWYDVEVKYDGPLPRNKFNGKIGKTLTLDQLLKGLTTTGIHYKIENGNSITITQ